MDDGHQWRAASFRGNGTFSWLDVPGYVRMGGIRQGMTEKKGGTPLFFIWEGPVGKNSYKKMEKTCYNGNISSYFFVFRLFFISVSAL
ncbi:hypothetical protein J31TS4_38330 [Paenibacillus sp. J31TS4]|nr:hypothetical protein J31TS4_38330 [Paenibacillus sp. J31TS4]